uniref:Uncharacterized protein n=1 Tax=Romanomermis culicivorax TaxID=13658 RepID=A0A915JWX2_ROMCU
MVPILLSLEKMFSKQRLDNIVIHRLLFNNFVFVFIYAFFAFYESANIPCGMNRTFHIGDNHEIQDLPQNIRISKRSENAGLILISICLSKTKHMHAESRCMIQGPKTTINHLQLPIMQIKTYYGY